MKAGQVPAARWDGLALVALLDGPGRRSPNLPMNVGQDGLRRSRGPNHKWDGVRRSDFKSPHEGRAGACDVVGRIGAV